MTGVARDYLYLDGSGIILRGREQLPALKPGQCYVNVDLAGICSTDEVLVAVRRGNCELPPSLVDAEKASRLGHEVIGRQALPGGGERFVAVIPAERVTSSRYRCMGLSPGSHGGWGSAVVAEEWAVVSIPSLAPRFVLTDSLAPGFALSNVLSPGDGRIVVLGLGALGLGALWGLSLAGSADLVGGDPQPDRRHAARTIVPSASFAPGVELQKSDRVVCALPTAGLTQEIVSDWADIGCRVWAFTHPTWNVDSSVSERVTWLHEPDADHAAAVRALASCDYADELVSCTTVDDIASSGTLPVRTTALRAAIRFAAGANSGR